MILVIIEKHYSKACGANTCHFLIIRYLKDTNNHKARFPELAWEVSGKSFSMDTITSLSIARPATIFPLNSTNFNPERPKLSDRFVLIPRQFSDRSGWQDSTNISNITGLDMNEKSVEEYLKAHASIDLN